MHHPLVYIYICTHSEYVVDSLGGLKDLACFRPEMFSGQVPLDKIPR